MTGIKRILLVVVAISLLPAVSPAQPAAAPDVSDEVLAQLSREQLYELLREKQFYDAGKVLSHGPRIDLVGILVPSIMFVCVVAAIAFGLAYRSRKDRQMHETLRLMVEKGADIPRELLAPTPRKNIDLRRGILLLAGGIGFMILIALIGIWEPNALRGLGAGAVPIFIGIGYLLVWRINKKHTGEK